MNSKNFIDSIENLGRKLFLFAISFVGVILMVINN